MRFPCIAYMTVSCADFHIEGNFATAGQRRCALALH